MQNFVNPITFPTIDSLLVAILEVVIIIAVPIVVIFIIYAGFLYVMAQGNPVKIQEASKALMYGIIGGVIIVGSLAVVQIVQNLANSFTP